LLTVVGMTGIAGLFLPFTFGTSPVDAVSNRELWRLALPAFLAVLASAASIRWVITGSFSGRERAIAYVVSASMAGVTLSLWFPFDGGPSTIQEWLAFVSPVPILAFGGLFSDSEFKKGAVQKLQPSDGDPGSLSCPCCAMPHRVLWRLGAVCVLRPGSRASVCASDHSGLCAWT
jgi:hypothetical protein